MRLNITNINKNDCILLNKANFTHFLTPVFQEEPETPHNRNRSSFQGCLTACRNAGSTGLILHRTQDRMSQDHRLSVIFLRMNNRAFDKLKMCVSFLKPLFLSVCSEYSLSAHLTGLNVPSKLNLDHAYGLKLRKKRLRR